jgi:hypothetical protein
MSVDAQAHDNLIDVPPSGINNNHGALHITDIARAQLAVHQPAG